MANRKFIFILLSCLFFTFAPLKTASDNSSYTVPIAHISTPTDQISRGELWAIFTLTVTQWESGQKIVLVVYFPDNQTQKAFLRDYFGMNSYRYQEILDGKVNTGRVSPPIIVETEQQMISEVSKKPGRIGFTRSFILVGDQIGYKRIKVN